MRAEWVAPKEIEFILRALTPENALACKVSLITGLRINDVLSISTAKWKKQRFTVREQKTGKTKRVRLPNNIYNAGLEIAGHHYVFENRLNGRNHRTRQAVYKDIKRASTLLRIRENITPHSMRKVYAVDYYEKSGSIKAVKELLNHSTESVTMLYALADVLTRRRHITKLRKI